MLKKSIILISMVFAFSILSSISFAAVICNQCNTGQDGCTCSITNANCDTGTYDIYNSTASTCLGKPIFENTFSNAGFTWSPAKAGTYYAKALCDNGVDLTPCNSMIIKSGGATTTTPGGATTTTSGGGKKPCPSDCCGIDDATYNYKPCTSGVCQNRKCTSTGGSDTNLIIGIVILIIIIAVVIYFFFIRKKKGTKGGARSFEELYRKWR